MLRRQLVLLGRPPWITQKEDASRLREPLPRGEVKWTAEKRRTNMSNSTFKDSRGYMAARRLGDVRWLAHFRKQRQKQEDSKNQNPTQTKKPATPTTPPPTRSYSNIFEEVVKSYHNNSFPNPYIMDELVNSGHHPLNILKELTNEGISIDDGNLALIINKLAESFANWGIEKTQKERGKLGQAVLKQIEDLCENHETGMVSASALLMCAVCIPLPATARRIFEEVTSEGVVINNNTCEAYLRMLVSFDQRYTAVAEFQKILDMGVNISEDVARILSSKNTLVAHNTQRKKLNRFKRKARAQEPPPRIC